MHQIKIDRRTVLKTAAALATIGLAPATLRAQAIAGRAAKALPARGEFVIRGATILSMDSGVGDFVRGDVHVRARVLQVQERRVESGQPVVGHRLS